MTLTPTQLSAVICAHCHRLRTAGGCWVLDTRPRISRTLFVSHGICPDCMERLFPEFCVPARPCRSTALASR
jgi:hypothetical protein